MSGLGQLFAVLQKELLVEVRAPGRVGGLFWFALAMLLLFAFASPTEGILRDQAGGALWIAILLASTRSLDASFSVEFEQGALDGLVLWPVQGWALFYGKALANTLVLIIVGVALLPLLLALYNAEMRGSWPMLGAFLVFGCAAIAAPGTLYALITGQARGSSLLLPLLLFPLVIPALLCCARGFTLTMQGDPMLQGPGWLTLLVSFNLVHWSLSGWFFARLLEDR